MKDFKVRVRLVDMVEGAQGTIFKVNDSFCVVIDNKLSEDEQAAVFLHEMLHIWHDDSSKECKLAQVEKERAAELPRLLTIMERASS